MVFASDRGAVMVHWAKHEHSFSAVFSVGQIPALAEGPQLQRSNLVSLGAVQVWAIEAAAAQGVKLELMSVDGVPVTPSTC